MKKAFSSSAISTTSSADPVDFLQQVFIPCCSPNAWRVGPDVERKYCRISSMAFIIAVN